MNEETFKAQLASVAPDEPARFHDRVETALETIALQEAHMKDSTKKAIRTAGRFSARTAILAAVLVMALTAAALAATQWHLFDSIPFLTGQGTPKNADAVMQGKLYRETVNNVEITVDEAGYDGRTLFLRYTYRILDTDQVFGVTAQEMYGGLLPEGMAPDAIVEESIRDGAEEALEARNVGWWVDTLWINGKAVDMPGGSGSVVKGSQNSGEIIHTEYWRLDQENVALNGPVTISLPIGEKQSLSDYSRKNHPERFDEEGGLLLPDKGVVTFTYDAKDVLSQVVTVHPGQAAALPEGEILVKEAAFTPLMTYITLELRADPDALEAYKRENGEGYKDENSQVIFPYGAMDLFSPWAMSAELVDGDGNLLFPGHEGLEALGETRAEYLYPYLESMPEELYLAPIQDGAADMARAVLVKAN